MLGILTGTPRTRVQYTFARCITSTEGEIFSSAVLSFKDSDDLGSKMPTSNSENIIFWRIFLMDSKTQSII